MAGYNYEEFQKEIGILYPRLHRVLAAYLAGSNIDPQDILQETFLKACKNLERFNGESGLYTWLYSIGRNLCIDEFRKQKKEKNLSNIPVENYELESDQFTTEAEKEEIILLRKAIAELPEQFREVVIMKSIDGMSFPEMAEITGINEQTLKNRMFRSRKMLAESLRRMGVHKP
ncbi:MAG: RNA polymerase sigma factor [Balneolales bacterium]